MPFQFFALKCQLPGLKPLCDNQRRQPKAYHDGVDRTDSVAEVSALPVDCVSHGDGDRRDSTHRQSNDAPS